MASPTRRGSASIPNLIDELLKNGITPWVTLYHWDLPLALQLEHDGWLSAKTVECFRDYADLCFAHFGDRVKNWITFNEPWVVATEGYGKGTFAPGRVSDAEPYQAAHQMLRAHGQAVDIYRSKYQRQGGRIGMTNNCDWREPRTGSEKDLEAAQRAIEFFLGWFGDPLYFGKYPDIMVARLGGRLPEFSDRDRGLIKESSDFFGLNHYTTQYVADASGGAGTGGVNENSDLTVDQDVELSADPAWARTAMGWAIVPWGLNRLLHWIDQRYGRPEIVISENGCAMDDRLADGRVDDPQRIDFYRCYLEECHKAIEAGVRLKGYFAWSFMDNFEWASGYSKRFGLHYVDFASGKRIAKASAAWFRQVMENNGF